MRWAWVKGERQVGRRRGISLLEVLISMFVITLGLLGLAALIPVGKTDVSAATRADRASALGRAAYRDFKIRGLLNDVMWISPSGNWFDVDEIPFDDATPIPGGHPLENGNSLCLDPLFVGREQENFGGLLSNHTWRGRAFPYPLDNDPWAVDNPDNAGHLKPPRMARANLFRFLGSTDLMRPDVAELIFRSQDDLLFQSLDVDPSGRPMLQHDMDNSTPANPIRPQYAGDYSWLVTITPTADWRTASGTSGVPANYTVSVVVFFKRPLVVPPNAEVDVPEPIDDRLGTRPTERVVFADFINGIGLGGGDVRLRLPIIGPENNTPGDPDSSDMPRVRPGQWILLSGWLRPDSSMPGLFASPDRMWAVFRWYRVVSADAEVRWVDDSTIDDAEGEWVQDVTLSGADWWPVSEEFNDIFFDADGTGPGTTPTVYASLFEGVAAVYEKTVQLDTTTGR